MATHSSSLAWEVPWTEAPGRLQSMGPRRVGHDGMTGHTQEDSDHAAPPPTVPGHRAELLHGATEVS